MPFDSPRRSQEASACSRVAAACVHSSLMEFEHFSIARPAPSATSTCRNRPPRLYCWRLRSICSGCFRKSRWAKRNSSRSDGITPSRRFVDQENRRLLVTRLLVEITRQTGLVLSRGRGNGGQPGSDLFALELEEGKPGKNGNNPNENLYPPPAVRLKFRVLRLPLGTFPIPQPAMESGLEHSDVDTSIERE
jgi:hypothetical protein